MATGTPVSVPLVILVGVMLRPVLALAAIAVDNCFSLVSFRAPFFCGGGRRRSRESCRAEDQVIIFCPTKQFCHNCALKVTDRLPRRRRPASVFGGRNRSLALVCCVLMSVSCRSG